MPTPSFLTRAGLLFLQSKVALDRVVRFAGVGAGATILYFLVGLAGVTFGLGLLMAHAVAVLLSCLASYAGRKWITFGVRGQLARTGMRFILTTALLLSSQLLLVLALHTAKAPEVIALLASTAFYPAASFLIHSLWTFRPPS